MKTLHFFQSFVSACALMLCGIQVHAQCTTSLTVGASSNSSGQISAQAVTSNTPGTGSSYYWTLSQASTTLQTAVTYTPDYTFSTVASGNYSICVYYSDSLNNCYANSCTGLTVVNTNTTCTAAYQYYVDSTFCKVYFTNYSSGANLSYEWYDTSVGSVLLSTSPNPALSLSQGMHHIVLYSYSSGQYCDSIGQNVYVNCTVPPPCHAAFSYYVDSVNCTTHLTNNSTGVNQTYQWVDVTSGYAVLSNQASPTLTLTPGQHNIALYVYSNNQRCDTVAQVINVSCSNPPPCHASFSYYVATNVGSGCMTHFYNNSYGSNLTYQWFDVSANNALLSTQSSPVITLSSGIHNIKLYILSNGFACDSLTQTVNANCGNPPLCQASFSYHVDSVNCTTYLTNSSTGANLTYQWVDVTSGYTLLSTQASPTLALTPGQHNIALYVYSNNQRCDTVAQVISVNCSNPPPCHASFSYYAATNVGSGCITHFYNNSTGSNLTYQWFDVSANNALLSTQASPVITLSSGVHNIKLYILSNGLACDSLTQAVNANCTPTTSCQANFQIFADSLNPGSYFAYNTSTGTNLSYLWNFGDGTTSTQQYPFHQYAVPGQYVVCLTITSAGTPSCTSTHCDSSSVHKIAASFFMSSLNVIHKDTATGVKESSVVKTLRAYPNPMSDQLSVEIETMSKDRLFCTLTDGLGRTVLRSEVSGTYLQINTALLEKGFYFLSVSDRRGSVYKTITLVK